MHFMKVSGARWRLVAVPVLAVAIASCGLVAGNGAMAQQRAGGQAADKEVAQLRKRVEQLEEQLVDIQVVLGTLETLARSGGASAAQSGGAQGGGFSGGDAGRLAALETQVRALSAQLQQSGGQGAAVPAGPPVSSGRVQGWNATTGSDSRVQAGDSGIRGGRLPAPSGFGSTTVQPGGEPSIGALASRDDRQAGSVGGRADGGDAQAEYEAAYGLLLQQDYGGAREAFIAFVKAHPRHSLAGNAQYWLGETYYVQGQYKSAAGAFLSGYRTYGTGSKAPDSLLKLAMSLDRLGQRAAACSSLAELRVKYPQAPQHVLQRGGQERRRLQC